MIASGYDIDLIRPVRYRILMPTERAPDGLVGLVGGAVRLGWKSIVFGGVFGASLLPAAADVSTPDTTFFETHIRPILAGQCYACHGEEGQAGGLRLDRLPVPSVDAVLGILQQRGADSHPAVSLEVRERESIRAWIAQGAPWPAPPLKRPKGGSMAEYIAASRTEHWAFKAVPTSVLDESDSRHPVDVFVQNRLDGVGLNPSPPADRDTLVRRAYHDLVGLPPSLEAIQRFEEDGAPDAFERVIDGLLASPHFGERWGRHWLDVARYSDTKGSSFREDRLFPFSHTYRDYVIRAFNEDLPYDQFIMHQLAADQMDLGEDKRPLAALGFLTLGKSFGANIHDQIDDRIDVVTRGLQGLTVNCARCHDHKFDPIPTADYYSLYGVFRSTQVPAELPLIEEPDLESPAYQAYLEGLEKVALARDTFLDQLHVDLLAHSREKLGDYLAAVSECWDDGTADQMTSLAEARALRLPLLQRWRATLKETAATPSPEFALWIACVSLGEENFALEVEALMASPAAPVNAAVLRTFRETPPTSMADVNRIYGTLLADVDDRWQSLLAARLQRRAREGSDGVALPEGLPNTEEEALRQLLYGDDSPANVPFGDVHAMSTTADRVRINQRQEAVTFYKNSHPGRPSRAMALEDSSTPFDPYVFIRGDATSQGEAVPRQFLAVLAGDQRHPFENGSGRLELAQAIVTKENPLTARVFVNRVWAQLFDVPIVGTPSDFGTQGRAPTHPQLLDYLAGHFMKEGWSVKSLLRHIMLSETYQQASDTYPEGEAVDPNNELLWHQNRRRLDFETMRDSLLVAAGNLDPSVGGFPVNITETPFSNRRTVYAEVDRHALPAMFRIFDFATPNEHTPMRFETTVPQQALYLMNSAFVSEQARLAASQEDVVAQEEAGDRVRALYHALLKREPSEKEQKLGVMFVTGQDIATRQPTAPRDTTWRYGYGAVDESTGQVTGFTEFRYWSGESFQQSDVMPDPTLGSALLNRLGGHPGGPGFAVVRRWTSKADTMLSCVGELYHHSSAGDGIRAYIVSSRAGILWQGDVQDGAIATVFDDIEIRVGDTVDLVVSCLENDEEDGFRWHPRLYLSGENAAEFETQDWITRFDFQGPPEESPEPLKPWEQYAQVLLMSNEFMFVD